ncbi:hypothetical protein FEZ33_04495 [Ruoffia tabacinasalis]|uniref:PepSY domain-containing protein n=1 Tax=Ruoffia tabacinasalis TaxID=87458 RepID=A0A5R9DW19_9LACT|nr:hypothetical protein [Ruoffia tabacinasalis]TLQ41825.1 hypothetical protein FEZ33_04495 [Ruoffia tabacinasalis]
MSENKNNKNLNYNYDNNGLLGGLLLATGVLIGAAATLLIKENRPKKAGLVLETAKNRLGQNGNVVGSWIDYDSIEYDLFEDKPLVYIGGVTVENAEGRLQYQFASDIYTGELIDYYLINQNN